MPTVTDAPGAKTLAAELAICASMTAPLASATYPGEIGPRNATDRTVDVPAASAVTVTASGRSRAVPAPEAIEPASVAIDVPSSRAWPEETTAGTLLFSPTNSATNGV